MKRKLCALLLIVCLLTGCSATVSNPITAPTLGPTVDVKLTPASSAESEDPTDSPSIRPTSTPRISPSTETSSGAHTEKPRPTAKPTGRATPKPTATAKPTPRTYNSDDTLADVDSRDYQGKYVGSAESDKYHYSKCRHAQRILIRNAIWWNSASAAQSSGYSPCGTCNPR